MQSEPFSAEKDAILSLLRSVPWAEIVHCTRLLTSCLLLCAAAVVLYSAFFD